MYWLHLCLLLSIINYCQKQSSRVGCFCIAFVFKWEVSCNHFMPLASFYSPWKDHVYWSFQGVEREQWHEWVHHDPSHSIYRKGKGQKLPTGPKEAFIILFEALWMGVKKVCTQFSFKKFTRTLDGFFRDCRKILPPILSEFERVNYLLFPLKPLEDL